MTFKMGPVKLNRAAFRALRTSDGAKRAVKKAADQIAADASRRSGEEYEAHESKGRNRARAVVTPGTYEAARDSAENLTLLRSMDAGRS